MTTEVYFHVGNRYPEAEGSSGDNEARLDGTETWEWYTHNLHLVRAGLTAYLLTADTVDGPTDGVEFGITEESGYPAVIFTSLPLQSDVTISGNITFNIRASESSGNANAFVGVIVERINNLGQVVSTIVQSENGVELGTSEAARNWSASPTSTQMYAGDRFRVRVYIYGDSMASGYTASMYTNGSFANQTGDSWIRFNETFSFKTVPGSYGTVYYLRDTDADVDPNGASYDGKMLALSQGSTSVIKAVNTAAGPTNPLLWTNGAGGNYLEWFTPELEAFTLSGLVKVVLSGLESNAAANVYWGAELAVCDGDGANPVVWAAKNAIRDMGYEFGTSYTIHTGYLAGDSYSVPDGSRLRLRLWIEDAGKNSDAGAMAGGYTASVRYGSSSYNTRIELEPTITEQTTPTLVYPPQAEAVAAAFLPTLVSGKVVSAPQASAIGGAFLPTIGLSGTLSVRVGWFALIAAPRVGAFTDVLAPQATATAEAFPSDLTVLDVPQAAASAEAFIPAVQAGHAVYAPLAQAQAQAVYPSFIDYKTLWPTTADAHAQANAPSLTGLSPQAAATATAFLPTLPMRVVVVPQAVAIAEASAPQAHWAEINPPVAEAVASAFRRVVLRPWPEGWSFISPVADMDQWVDGWSPVTPSENQVAYDGTRYAYTLVQDIREPSEVGFHRYDCSNDAWERLEPPEVGRDGASSVCYGGKVFFFGGFEFQNGEFVSDGLVRTLIYDIASGTWSLGQEMPSNPWHTDPGNEYRYWGQAVEVDGLVYIFGGEYSGSAAGSGEDRYDIYDPARDEWRKLGQMPYGSFDAEVVYDPNSHCIYVMGDKFNGWYPDWFLMLIYHIDEDEFEDLGSLPDYLEPVSGGWAGHLPDDPLERSWLPELVSIVVNPRNSHEIFALMGYNFDGDQYAWEAISVPCAVFDTVQRTWRWLNPDLPAQGYLMPSPPYWAPPGETKGYWDRQLELPGSAWAHGDEVYWLPGWIDDEGVVLVPTPTASGWGVLLR